MELKRTEEVLQDFAHKVISAAQKRLGPQDVSKELSKSLDYNIHVGPNSIDMDFLMNQYGLYQDQGVKGTESGKSFSGYSYKKSSNLIGFEYKTGTFAKWAKFRRMQPRTAKGRFGSYKSMGFILAQSIKKKGIKPTLFFTKPFEKYFEQLDKELVESYDLDLDSFIDFTLKTVK